MSGRSEDTICFQCHGGGKSLARANFGYDETEGRCRTGPMREIDCLFCGGTGRVSWDQVAGRIHGARIQGWRAAMGIMTIDMAKQLGLSPAELSAYETGRQAWPESVKDQAAAFMAQTGGRPGVVVGSEIRLSRDDAQRALSVLSAFPMPSDPNLHDDWHASIACLRAALRRKPEGGGE